MTTSALLLLPPRSAKCMCTRTQKGLYRDWTLERFAEGARWKISGACLWAKLVMIFSPVHCPYQRPFFKIVRLSTEVPRRSHKPHNPSLETLQKKTKNKKNTSGLSYELSEVMRSINTCTRRTAWHWWSINQWWLVWIWIHCAKM